MGTQEKEVRQRKQKENIQKAILTAVAVAGVLLVAAAAPNALQILGGISRKRKRFTDQAQTALTRLARKGQICFEERNGKKYARITGKGKRTLAFELYKTEFATRKKPRWDKRWRVVIFDIPEAKRSIRVRLRMFMRQFGFLRIQDSVWAYPYDCEELVALMKAEVHIGKDVLYMIVESVENDDWMRRHFGFPEKNRGVEIKVPGTSFDILSLLYK